MSFGVNQKVAGEPRYGRVRGLGANIPNRNKGYSTLARQLTSSASREVARDYSLAFIFYGLFIDYYFGCFIGAIGGVYPLLRQVVR